MDNTTGASLIGETLDFKVFQMDQPILPFYSEIEFWDYDGLLACDENISLKFKDTAPKPKMYKRFKTYARTVISNIGQGVQNMKSKMSSLKKQLFHLKIENEELDAQNRKTKADVTDLETVLCNNREVKQVLSQDLKDQHDQHETAVAQRHAELDARNEMCRQTQRKLEISKDTIKNLEEKFRRQMEAKDLEISKLQSKNHELSVAKENLECKVDDMRRILTLTLPLI